MLKRTKLVDIELGCPLASIEDLGGYTALQGLVRLHGIPIGYVEMPVIGDRCPAGDLGKAILNQLRWPLIRHLLSDSLAAPRVDEWSVADLVDAPHAVCNVDLPLVTVAVCTRDRTDNLAICLDAITRLDYAHLDVLVVDNAPINDETERLVRTSYPDVRYVCEPRPGLNWARNRAILEAQGEIIAYTDDDVVVDPGWVSALAEIFAENPKVMAVTGLVVPYELETEAQLLFEQYGGFGRGFERQWYQTSQSKNERWQFYGAGRYGTGANMAYRRSLFDQIGFFDPALDVGTVTNGGGDLEMFFRVLVEGHTLVYAPAAIVRHRHRRDYAQLRTQIRNNGVGFYAYLVRSALAYPRERAALIRLGVWWLWKWNVRRLLISLVRPGRFPRDLILAELRGAFIGLGRYQKARRAAAQIADAFGTDARIEVGSERNASQDISSKHSNATGVRTIDLSQPPYALTDVTDYMSVRVFVTWNGRPLGYVDVANQLHAISASRLRHAIVDRFGLKLLDLDGDLGMDTLWAKAIDVLDQHFMPEDGKPSVTSSRLPVDVPVSVVVATLDRADDLRECLRCLTAQASPRQVEIIIVDNNPSSGLTPPVVAEFPGVVLVSEPRKGLSYARNRGFAASQGDIVIATDDDVRMPPDWLEKLMAPFARPEVMVVTGNVLPLELETPAQRLFEKYGGLGRGFEPFEVNGEWFESFKRHAVPTWNLGATANAAFRASIFGHPAIGLLDEALGVGTPTGCSEDTYLFYQVLKADYMIAYEPTAYVWHKHRQDMSALRRQIYGYSKGHVAYHLTTLLRHHDLRAIFRLGYHLPRWHFRQILLQIKHRLLRRKNDYPFSLTLLEILGNLVGPWALWRSRRQVKRKGRSQPCLPPSQRTVARRALSSAELQHCTADLNQATTAEST